MTLFRFPSTFTVYVTDRACTNLDVVSVHEVVEDLDGEVERAAAEPQALGHPRQPVSQLGAPGQLRRPEQYRKEQVGYRETHRSG